MLFNKINYLFHLFFFFYSKESDRPEDMRCERARAAALRTMSWAKRENLYELVLSNHIIDRHRLLPNRHRHASVRSMGEVGSVSSCFRTEYHCKKIFGLIERTLEKGTVKADSLSNKRYIFLKTFDKYVGKEFKVINRDGEKCLDTDAAEKANRLIVVWKYDEGADLSTIITAYPKL